MLNLNTLTVDISANSLVKKFNLKDKAVYQQMSTKVIQDKFCSKKGKKLEKS